MTLDPRKYLLDAVSFGQPAQLRGEVLLKGLPSSLSASHELSVNFLWDVAD
jgi:hypothetical protein